MFPSSDDPQLVLRGEVRPKTVDMKARTVELIASTGAGYQRFDAQGPFLEVLEISSSAIDLSRLDGMPLLDSHRQVGLEDVLGVVRGARIEAGSLIVTVEFSERADAVWKDVVAGIIRNVSVGYQVTKWADSPVGADKMRKRTAVKWTPFEVSIVPVGADPAAKVRSEEMRTSVRLPLPVFAPEGAPAPAPAPVIQPPAPIVPPAPSTRAQVNQHIRALAATMGLGNDFTDPLIDAEASVEAAQTAAIAEIGRRRAAAPTAHSPVILHSNDDPSLVVRRMAEATFARANPGHRIDDAARQYYGMSCLDMARTCLQMRGMTANGRTAAETIDLALRIGGMHTTSDFPTIFADTATRVLQARYATIPSALKRVARQTTAKDFRAKTVVKAQQDVTLDRVEEAGEYTYGSFKEAKEGYRIDTFGKIVAISRQALINDDLGAFTDIAGQLGVAAAQFEAQFLVDLLQSNSGNGPTMDDGNPLFHTTHGNKASAGAAPSEATLQVGWNAINRATGLNGQIIGLIPKFVISSNYNFVLDQILASVSATKTSDVNTMAGKLENLTEPRLTGNRWYIAADPAVQPSFEYAYLLGQEGPQTESQAGWNVDGVEVKVRLDFGAGFTDYRGWWLNAGA